LIISVLIGHRFGQNVAARSEVAAPAGLSFSAHCCDVGSSDRLAIDAGDLSLNSLGRGFPNDRCISGLVGVQLVEFLLANDEVAQILLLTRFDFYIRERAPDD
jgi:hypothetical protein